MIKAIDKNIASIKSEIMHFKREGADIDVKVSLGRNKYVTYKGKVTSVYPALFTVSPDGEFGGKTSFSYSEVMCGAVTLTRAGNNA